jgi:hypothetical protein
VISTVTTSTIGAVAAVTSAATLSMMAVVALLLLLVQKEIASSADDPRLVALAKVLDIALVPVLLAFLFIAAVRVAEVLN